MVHKVSKFSTKTPWKFDNEEYVLFFKLKTSLFYFSKAKGVVKEKIGG